MPAVKMIILPAWFCPFSTFFDPRFPSSLPCRRSPGQRVACRGPGVCALPSLTSGLVSCRYGRSGHCTSHFSCREGQRVYVSVSCPLLSRPRSRARSGEVLAESAGRWGVRGGGPKARPLAPLGARPSAPVSGSHAGLSRAFCAARGFAPLLSNLFCFLFTFHSSGLG